MRGQKIPAEARDITLKSIEVPTQTSSDPCVFPSQASKKFLLNACEIQAKLVFNGAKSDRHILVQAGVDSHLWCFSHAQTSVLGICTCLFATGSV